MTLALILLTIGLLLVAAEILFPSLGVLSVLATASIAGSLVVAFQSGVGIEFSILTVVLLPVVIGFAMKVFPNTPMGRKMVARGLSFESRRATDTRDLELEGTEGVVVAGLRPAGIAKLDGRRVDVVSRGEMIEAGAHVRVLEVSGNRVVVGRTDAPEGDARS